MNETTASERERFDAWERTYVPHYNWGPREIMFAAWQARAALPAPADPPSQEAREYPPQARALLDLADKYARAAVNEERTRAATGGYPPQMLSAEARMALQEALRSYVDADRKARQQEARRCLAFFASCIKSGEPWTEECQRMYDAAIAKGERHE